MIRSQQMRRAKTRDPGTDHGNAAGGARGGFEWHMICSCTVRRLHMVPAPPVSSCVCRNAAAGMGVPTLFSAVK
ncbi:hypothetical protein GCM10008966_27210 [Rhodovulum strictum]